MEGGGGIGKLAVKSQAVHSFPRVAKGLPGGAAHGSDEEAG